MCACLVWCGVVRPQQPRTKRLFLGLPLLLSDDDGWWWWVGGWLSVCLVQRG